MLKPPVTLLKLLWLLGQSKDIAGLIKLQSSLLCPQPINLPSQDRKRKPVCDPVPRCPRAV
jgi:hypothetical protein